MAAGSSRERLATAFRAHGHWLIPVVVLAGLIAPLASDRTFASDWGNHLWLIWVQGQNIGVADFPNYYLQSTLGAFYPYYAFYGGTMYTVLGFVAWLTDGSVAAAAAVCTALVVAYLSWTWLAHQAGLRRWVMQIPGALAVTAPYAVTNVYGRGDIPEMIALATIPLIAASGFSLVSHERISVRAAVAFVLGVTVLTGTHTLTLVWGTTFLLLCGLALVVYDWRLARAHARRALRPLGLGLLGVLINAWMLGPLLLYHGRLLEGAPDPMSSLEHTDRAQLFSLFRDGAGIAPGITADLNTQLPVLVLFWAIVFGATFWSALGRRRQRLTATLALVCGAFLMLIMIPSLIEQAPTVWRYIQFPYRLLAYFDLAVVGVATLILAAAVRAGRPGRVAVALLAVIAAGAFYASLIQNDAVRSWLPDRAAATASAGEPPPSWYAPLQFADASAAIVEPTLAGELVVPVSGSKRDGYSVELEPGPAGSVATNVLAGDYLVDISGAEPVGRTAEGRMVVELPASEQPRKVTFTAAWGAAVELGRWLSLAAIVVALLALIWMLAAPERIGRLRRGLAAGRGRDG